MKHYPCQEIEIENRKVGPHHPAYFIADVAANHDGDLGRAKELIYLASEAGADAAKFQHFSAETIVSDEGFRGLGRQFSHQASWGKSVYDVYDEASLNPDWTPALKEACDECGIHFFTSPYSFDLINAVDPFVPAYKVGSGDITWLEIIDDMSARGKPVLLATGASSLSDVEKSMDTVLSRTGDVVLMQCNTNYTASLENFKYINLEVLKLYAAMYPGVILGLSDHTPGHTTVLGAVSLGAKVIEKHFTDDCSRVGPDHKFSMDPKTWKEMVLRTRELEAALGEPLKKVEDNELDTVILQRRSIRAAKLIPEGKVIAEDDLTVLRPCPTDGLVPSQLPSILGQCSRRSISKGDHITWTDLQ